MREEEERRRIEDALKAEAERRLLDEAERQRIIALARHLWNKGVRIEGEHLEQELEISSIFYSYFNYLESSEPFNSDIDVHYAEKLASLVKKDKVWVWIVVAMYSHDCERLFEKGGRERPEIRFGYQNDKDPFK